MVFNNYIKNSFNLPASCIAKFNVQCSGQRNRASCHTCQLHLGYGILRSEDIFSGTCSRKFHPQSVSEEEHSVTTLLTQHLLSPD